MNYSGLTGEASKILKQDSGLNVTLNHALNQVQGLRFQGLVSRDSEPILKYVQHKVQNDRCLNFIEKGFDHG